MNDVIYSPQNVKPIVANFNHIISKLGANMNNPDLERYKHRKKTAATADISQYGLRAKMKIVNGRKWCGARSNERAGYHHVMRYHAR